MASAAGVLPLLIKKQQQRVKGRSAYKSYIASFTMDNTEKLPGFNGLNLLHSFKPQIEKSLKNYGGLTPAKRGLGEGNTSICTDE